MSACRAEFEELVDLYSVGTLDGGEREVFERHLLSGCDTCRGAVNEAERAFAVIGLAAPPAEPSPALRERLLRSLPGPPPRRFGYAPWLAAAAAVWLVAAVAGWSLWWQRGIEIDAARASLIAERDHVQSLEARARELSDALAAEKKSGADWLAQAQSAKAEIETARVRITALDAQVRQLTADLGTATAEIQRLREEAGGLVTRAERAETELRAQSDELAFLSSPKTRRVELTAEPGKGSRVATAFVDLASGRTFVRGVGMPPLPPGRVYQLWYVNHAKDPVSGGTFTSSDSDRGYEHAGPAGLKEEAVLGLTVEPEGGSASPTPPVFAYGLLAAK